MKNIFITISVFDPDRNSVMDSISKEVMEILPVDYIEVLQQYGEGTFCDAVAISYPDEKRIQETYKDYTELWHYDEHFSLEDLLTSVYIGYNTCLGDEYCVARNKKGRVFVLPRNDKHITSFHNLQEVLNYYTDECDKKFYEPSYYNQDVYLPLNKANDKQDITAVHNTFLLEYSVDFICTYNDGTLLVYYLKELGMKISFSLSTNRIDISYQKELRHKSQPILNRLELLSGVRFKDDIG